MENGFYSDALEQLTLAIAENSKFADAYFARAICYHVKGEKELAL